jgi:hypothetical protein
LQRVNQVNEAITKDPHGTVARHASHWLAVEVMGWTLQAGIYYDADGKHLMLKLKWQPFTDANHLGMICEKVELLISYQGNMTWKDFVLECALDALAWQHKEDTLTNDTLKGWLEND